MSIFMDYDIERDYHDVILKTYYEMAIAKINKGDYCVYY